MSVLDYDHTNGIATIVLNNPPQNRMSEDLLKSFAAALHDLTSRDDTRAVLLRAEGENFGFGGDIASWLKHDAESVEKASREGLALFNAFENLPYPVVAEVQGICIGGALELVLRADIIVAADSAQFGHPEATVGIFTLVGGIQRVAERVGRTRAMQWALTAEMVAASTAKETGLINDVVPAAELRQAGQAWAEKLAKGPTLAHADHKTLLRAWSNGGIAAADDLIPAMLGKTLMSEDCQGSVKEAIEAAMQGKPRPEYDFKGK